MLTTPRGAARRSGGRCSAPHLALGLALCADARLDRRGFVGELRSSDDVLGSANEFTRSASMPAEHHICAGEVLGTLAALVSDYGASSVRRVTTGQSLWRVVQHLR